MTSDYENTPVQALETESRRIEEDSLHSAKSQFSEARFWSHLHYWIGLPTAVLAAGAGASAFAQEGVIAGIMATVVAGLTAALTLLNPTEKATRHHDAGTQYLALRNGARVYREIDLPTVADNETNVHRLKELCQQRDRLNKESPQVLQRSFLRARRAIERGEADYEVDRRTGSLAPPPN